MSPHKKKVRIRADLGRHPLAYNGYRKRSVSRFARQNLRVRRWPSGIQTMRWPVAPPVTQEIVTLWQ